VVDFELVLVRVWKRWGGGAVYFLMDGGI
jgi:hypothetical protein